MRRKLAVAALLLWVPLAGGATVRSAGQAQDVTLTLTTDQAAYAVHSSATVTLTLDATTPISLRIGGHEALGCDWNLVILDATDTEVFNARAGERGECYAIASFINVPPPLVKQATISLHNNLQGGGPLPSGRYTVRGVFWWQPLTPPGVCGPPPGRGCEPSSAEVVIEITP